MRILAIILLCSFYVTNVSGDTNLKSNQTSSISTFNILSDSLVELTCKTDVDFKNIILKKHTSVIDVIIDSKLAFSLKIDSLNEYERIDFCYHDFSGNGKLSVVLFLVNPNLSGAYCLIYKEKDDAFHKLLDVKSDYSNTHIIGNMLLFIHGNNGVYYRLNGGIFESKVEIPNALDMLNQFDLIESNKLFRSWLSPIEDKYNVYQNTWDRHPCYLKIGNEFNHTSSFAQGKWDLTFVVRSYGLNNYRSHLRSAFLKRVYISGDKIAIGQSKESISKILKKRLTKEKLVVRGTHNWRGYFLLWFKKDELYAIIYSAPDLSSWVEEFRLPDDCKCKYRPRNYTLGDDSPNVLYLHKILNTNALTQMARSGVNSPGNEGSMFSEKTTSSIKKFQKFNSLKVSGRLTGETNKALIDYCCEYEKEYDELQNLMTGYWKTGNNEYLDLKPNGTGTRGNSKISWEIDEQSHFLKIREGYGCKSFKIVILGKYKIIAEEENGKNKATWIKSN